MFQSGGQSDAKTPSVKFESKLGTHLSTHCRDERLSEPCPARDLKLGPMNDNKKKENSHSAIPSLAPSTGIRSSSLHHHLLSHFSVGHPIFNIVLLAQASVGRQQS
ncbi:hypothetical protein TNCV_1134251 [Trichonephila clavipes]|nr:hypothetical protein TNCV_1134251 [Trichonephila clavipes]